MGKNLRLLLVLELVSMLVVTMLFRTLPEKRQAAVLAGSLFVVLGCLICGYGLWSRDYRRLWTWRIGLIHLFVTSIPMLGLRIWNWEVEFKDVLIFGLPGPLFHHVSELVYLVLLISTVVEAWQLRKNN